MWSRSVLLAMSLITIVRQGVKDLLQHHLPLPSCCSSRHMLCSVTVQGILQIKAKLITCMCKAEGATGEGAHRYWGVPLVLVKMVQASNVSRAYEIPKSDR